MLPIFKQFFIINCSKQRVDHTKFHFGIFQFHFTVSQIFIIAAEPSLHACLLVCVCVTRHFAFLAHEFVTRSQCWVRAAV